MRSTYLLIAAMIAVAVGSHHLAGVIGVSNRETLTIPCVFLYMVLAILYRRNAVVLTNSIACVAIYSISATQSTFSLLMAIIFGVVLLIFVAVGLYEVGIKQPQYRYWSAFALAFEGLIIWGALSVDDSLLVSIGLASIGILYCLWLQYLMPDTSKSHITPAALP